MSGPLFPPWSTGAFRWALGVIAVSIIAAPCLLMGWVRSDYITGEHNALAQPVMFDHRHHVLDDRIDCRYCHWPAERSPWSGVPPASVCMSCHNQVWRDAPALAPVRASAASGVPIHWRRVTSLADFVFFNHATHVARGIGCVSCHGHVERMARVYQATPMTMSWCLDCHRHPEARVRPPAATADMDWSPRGESQEVLGRRLVAQLGLRPPLECSGCHR